MTIEQLATLDSLESLKLSSPVALTDSFQQGATEADLENQAMADDAADPVWMISELMDCDITLEEAQAAVYPIANGVGCEPSLGW